MYLLHNIIKKNPKLFRSHLGGEHKVPQSMRCLFTATLCVACQFKANALNQMANIAFYVSSVMKHAHGAQDTCKANTRK